MSSPFNRLIQGTSDASGNLTVRFPDTPPVGQTWTGALSVPGAPSGAFFQATVAGTPWATGIGPGAFGPVQALGNFALIVTATGLVPLTAYTVYWQGTADNAQDAPVIWPDLPALPPAYNGPVLLDRADTIAPLGQLVYPMQTCGNWQSVAINYQSSTAPSQLLLEWFSDAAGTVELGSKIVVVDANLFANFTIPNQGPFLQIIASSAAVSPTVTMIMAMTNRSAVPWAPQSMLPVIDAQNIALASMASQTIKAGYAYAGPCFASGLRDVNSFKFALQALELSGTVHTLLDWDTSTGTTGANQHQELIVPPMRLQVVITNTSAGPGNFDFSLVGDLFH